jgi:hypothetical protein
MKEQEHLPQEATGSKKEKSPERKPITSDSVKNAHATGDGAMGRSIDSIPDEDELARDDSSAPPQHEQY